MKNFTLACSLPHKNFTTLCLIALLLFSSLFSFSQTNSNVFDNQKLYSPEGKLDSVFDAFGNKMILNDITTDLNERINRTNNQRSYRLCQPGYFDLYFEENSGFESNTQQHINRRAVLCQVFQDISNFIVSPLTQNPTQRVCIWIRDFDVLNPNNSAPNIFSQGSSFYCMPPTTGNTYQIADGEVFKTIISGQNSYNNVNAALSNLALLNGGNSSYFFHGYMAFDKTVQWNTDLNAPTITNFDLYTVALKEAMHVLGFQSLINFIGESKFNSSNYRYFSRYDTFLRKNNTPLLTGNSACPLTGFVFNPTLGSPYTALTSGTCFIAPPQLNTNTDISNCNNSIAYVSTFSQTVFTPICYEQRFSLSHFDDNCQVPAGVTLNPSNDRYFVMSNRNIVGTVGIKRSPQPIERQVLCDIGYNVGTTFRTTNYGGVNCTRSTPGGINDGLGPNFNYTITTNTLNGLPPLAPIPVLANDINATTIACANLLLGNGIVTITGANTTITYTPAPGTPFTQGLHLISYVPFSITNQPGNLTYVFIYVSDPACAATNCNLVQNNSFENGLINSCSFLNSQGAQNRLNCWSVLNTSVDLFNRGCQLNTFFNVNFNTQNSIPAANDWTGGNNPANDKFIGIAAGLDGLNNGATELVQTFLSTPLIPNQQYTLTVRTAVNNNINITQGGVTLNSNITVPLLFAASPNILNANPFAGNTFVGVTPISITQTNQVTFNIPPQVIGNTSIVWNLNSLTFTYNGAVPANNLIIAINPSLIPTPTVAGSRQPAYVFIDDVSITPIVGPMVVQPQNPTIYEGASVLLTASPGNNVNWTPSIGLSTPTNSNTTNASPSTTTSYSALGTILNCAVQGSTTVNVIPCAFSNVNNLQPIIIGNGTIYPSTNNLPPVLSNRFVTLIGDFTVSTLNFEFNNCLVYCAPGTRILNNNNLVLRKSTFYSCFQQWRGFENDGLITMDNSLIQDAQYAINFLQKGNLIAKNSNFRRNFVGLRWIQALSNLNTNLIFLDNVEFNGLTAVAGQPQNLLPMFSGQTPVTVNNRPHAGIWMDDIPTSIILNSSVRFRNLTNGIISNGNDISLNGTQFFDINSFQGGNYNGPNYGLPYTLMGNSYGYTAVYIRNANLTMIGSNPIVNLRDCFRGVVGEGAGAEIKNNVFTNSYGAADWGIFMFNAGIRDININGNFIRVNSRGITSFQNDNANVFIQDNELRIGIGGTFFPKGILVSNGGNALNHKIEFNNIQLINNSSNPGVGIEAIAANGIKIRSNMPITLTNTNAEGIVVSGSSGATIECNEIIGSTTANVALGGIRVDLCQNAIVSNNFVQNVPNGFVFNNNNAQVDFRRNRMRNLRTGLQINPSGIISSQFNKGNLWGGTFSSFRARCDGLTTLNQFQNVNTTTSVNAVNYTFLPLANQQFPTNWFQLYTGANPITQHTACTNIYPTFATNFDLKVANNEWLDSTFNDTYKFISRIKLLRKIDEDTLGEYVAPTFQNFYTNMLNTEEKKHATIDSLSEKISDTPTKETYLESQALVKDFIYDVYQLDSLIHSTSDSILLANYWTQRDSLKSSLIISKDEESLKQNEVNQEMLLNTYAILTKNDLLNPTGVSAEYEKAINNIYYQKIIKNEILDESEIYTIFTAANTCPLLGGLATYKARSIYNLINDSIIYNDVALCLAQNLAYKVSEEGQINKNVTYVFPNPTNGNLFVQPPASWPERLHFQFYSLTGQLNKTLQIMNKDFSLIELNAKDIGSGIYFLKIYSEEKNLLVQKVVIQPNE